MDVMQASGGPEQLPEWRTMAADALVLAAHDLENPLQAILLRSQFIERLVQEDPLRALEAARAIGRSAQRMAGMVSDMLDAAQSGFRELLGYESVAVRALFGAVEDEVALAAKARGVFLTFELPAGAAAVSCDAARIARVLSNLAADAVREAGAGGSVRVSAGVRDEVVIFELSVDSPGWSGAVSEEPPLGLGLGRYIATTLLAAHGTGLVQSEAGGHRGRTRSFALPRVRAAAIP